MNEEKDRLKKRMEVTGLPGKDLRPSYLHPILWEQLLKYWDSEGHKHRSEVGSNNRKQVETLHSAGAKPFEAIEMVESFLNFVFKSSVVIFMIGIMDYKL